MTARDCAAYSRPMMRPLVYDWPDDLQALAIEDEFLLGESLLVAPLLEENAKSRPVYLPHGQWIGLFDHIQYEGGQQTVAGTKDRLPVFLRCGSGLPLNLGETLVMGSAPKREVGRYDRLHFLLAGLQGEQPYHDGFGSDFVITWRDGKVTVTGTMICSVTWEIISKELNG